MATNLKLGSVNIGNMYLGNIVISKAYLGNTLIYSKASEPEPTVTAGLLGDMTVGPYKYYKENASEADPTLTLTGNSIKIVPVSSATVAASYHVLGLNASTKYTLTWSDSVADTWVEVYPIDNNHEYLSDTQLVDGKSSATSQTVTKQFSGYTGYSVEFYSTSGNTCTYSNINMS